MCHLPCHPIFRSYHDMLKARSTLTLDILYGFVCAFVPHLYIDAGCRVRGTASTIRVPKSLSLSRGCQAPRAHVGDLSPSSWCFSVRLRINRRSSSYLENRNRGQWTARLREVRRLTALRVRETPRGSSNLSFSILMLSKDTRPSICIPPFSLQNYEHYLISKLQNVDRAFAFFSYDTVETASSWFKS